MTAKNKIGREFEEVFADKYGVDKVKNSGAGLFFKMDAENAALLFSLKATANKSFSVKKDDLKEVFDAVKGPGGVGGDIIPAMCFTLLEEEKPTPSDSVFIMLDFNDLVRLLTEDRKIFKEDKVSAKYREADTPSLLRDLDNEEE